MDYLKIPSRQLMRSASFLFCLTCCFVLVACSSKKEAAKESADAINLTGTWELRKAQNGMMPTAQHAPGNGNFFRFTPTTFEQYNNGALVRSGSYSLDRDTTVSASVGLELPKGQFDHRILFEKDTTEKTFIDLRGDTLEMITGFFPVDAGSRRVFVKSEDAQ
jgi:hypothetical protein